MDQRLLWSDDDGVTWREDAFVAPLGRRLLAAQFLDSLSGWVVVAGAGRTEVVRTSNAGSRWDHSNVLLVPRGEEPASASLSFLNERTGYLMLRLPSSSNFSRGALFRTDDGGRAWRLLPTPPIGDEIRFVSEQDGWLAGGPAGSDLFVTRDGGNSWNIVSVAPPTGAPNGRLVYLLPLFESDEEGLLPVRVESPEASSIVLYRTQDRGRSWALLGSTAYSVPGIHPLDLRDQTIITTDLGGTVMTLGQVGGTEKVRREVPRGLPSGFDISILSFANLRRGWVVVDAGECVGFKIGCWRERKILRTRDGGASFEDVTPVFLREANRQTNNSARHREPSPLFAPPKLKLIGSGTQVQQNRDGFDIACNQSVGIMQSWWTSSPYYYVGAYIGGINAWCTNHSTDCPCSSASWFSQTSSQGWTYIPIWVGVQEGGISSNTTSAFNQGVSEANSAADRMAALSFTQGSIIYFDFEQPHLSSSEAKVKAFVNGWTSQLHARGQNAGIYGSFLSAAAWQGSGVPNPPDAIWPYNLNVGQTVFGLCNSTYCLPDDLWSNHQRIHQYVQNVNSGPYGGVILRIDKDFADGPVAVYGGGTNKPDLVVTALSAPTTGTIGSIITISSEVANQGVVTAGIFREGYYFSSDSNITTDDVLFAVCNFSSGLPASSGGTCNGPVTIPSSVSPGIYYLGAIVDDQQQVNESNEGNNVRVADSGRITIVASCSYSLSSASQSFGSNGGSGNFSLNTQSGCSWSATSDSSWISITSGSGTGSGTVSFSVSSNGSTNSRSGHINVGGQTFTVNQSGIACSYSLPATSESFPSGGGSGSFRVNTQSGCSWSAASDSNWLPITSGSGTGNGAVSYDVSFNSSTNSRSGHINVGGQTFTINQSGISCSYSLSSASQSFGSGGGSGNFSVNTQSGCSWSAASDSGWVAITSGSSTGGGTVSFSVSFNSSTNSRTGHVIVAGQTFTVSQTAAPTPADFDGDRISDWFIYRSGAWLYFGPFSGAGALPSLWSGAPSPDCIPAPADYDGDGKIDLSLKCGGSWNFYNIDGSYKKGIWTGGLPGDLPVPADYNGDGKADVVVFRGGAWMFYDYGTGAYREGVWTGPGPGTLPVPMDYDGDGRADFTVYQNGAWHFYNHDGTYFKGVWTGGVAGDVPVPGKYHNVGQDEVVIFRGGAWLFFSLATGTSNGGVWTGAAPYAGRPLQPAPLDLDGDGTLEFTVYAGGPWHFYSDDGTYLRGVWTGGLPGDLPISRRQLLGSTFPP